MNSRSLGYEREQALAHWKTVDPKRLLVRADSIIKNVKRDDMVSLGQSIRRFHNFLGYQAWGVVEEGGKCAGCLYRSGKFIGVEPEERRSKEQDDLPVSIHLEHLIPVVTMRERLKEMVASGAACNEILRFVLRRSIAVGVHRAQRDGADALVKPGLHAHSHVFTQGHEDVGLPFRRYRELEGLDNKIFNVHTGQTINLNTFTLDQSWSDLIDLVKESGNDKGLLEWLV